MAKSVDALASGASGVTSVSVRVRFWARKKGSSFKFPFFVPLGTLSPPPSHFVTAPVGAYGTARAGPLLEYNR